MVKGSTGKEPRVAFVTTSLSLDPPDREMHPVWQCYARCNDNPIWLKVKPLHFLQGNITVAQKPLGFQVSFRAPRRREKMCDTSDQTNLVAGMGGCHVVIEPRAAVRNGCWGQCVSCCYCVHSTEQGP